jgi:AcrR family transcriptional regulator
VARTVGSAADDTRQRILDVAVDLFIEHGYAGTSVRDISERLGMTKGSLYYHFASKEDVLNALVKPLLDDLDAFVADADPLTGAATVGRDERALVERLVTLLDRHGVLLRSLMGDPSVLRGVVVKRSMPARIAGVQRALGGSADSSCLLRGRLALGVIHAGAISPRWDAVTSDGTWTREQVLRGRLTEDDKRHVIDAAIAVLGVVPAC